MCTRVCVGNITENIPDPLFLQALKTLKAWAACWTGLKWMGFTFLETLLFLKCGLGDRMWVLESEILASTLPQSAMLAEQIS